MPHIQTITAAATLTAWAGDAPFSWISTRRLAKGKTEMKGQSHAL